jgi:glucose/arabinose dehydrogenase
VPDVLPQAHSASLGITFCTGQQFPSEYLTAHGLWNRGKRNGYKVIRVII